MQKKAKFHVDGSGCVLTALISQCDEVRREMSNKLEFFPDPVRGPSYVTTHEGSRKRRRAFAPIAGAGSSGHDTIMLSACVAKKEGRKNEASQSKISINRNDRTRLWSL